MSGIAGIFFLNGRPIDRTDLERMSDTLKHRGSDGQGIWRQGSVGFIHRMLWTTPESLHEKLPLTSPDGNCTITADARIDNREELIPALGFSGRPAESISDSELILAAYQKWGEECPRRLLGDFAFAIWDHRRRTLFCARDHMGVKPFYYYAGTRTFALSSEIKGLLSLPEIPSRLNELRIGMRLTGLSPDLASTFYEEIVRLPPSHSLKVGREGISLQRYGSLDPSRTVRLPSDEAYAQQLRRLLSEAVRCRLRSAKPVGFMLSGGLDSSSMTCLGRQLFREGKTVGGRLNSFSLIFPEFPACDERRYIQEVLSGGDIESHAIRGDTLSPLPEGGRIFDHEDEGYLPSFQFHIWGLLRAARLNQTGILLSGFGGDSVVSYGSVYLWEQIRTGQWSRAFAQTQALSRTYGASFFKVIWCLGLREPLLYPIRRGWWAMQQWIPRWGNRRSLIHPDFSHRIGLWRSAYRLRSAAGRPSSTAREAHWRELIASHVPLQLEIMDRTAAAFSIELRYPFLDRRVVEFCLALPSDQKLRRGWTRWVLRRAMAGIIPESIRWRIQKANFWSTFQQSLWRFERQRLQEWIGQKASVSDLYVDRQALQRSYARYCASQGHEEVSAIWAAVTLRMWLAKSEKEVLQNAG